MDNVTIDFGTNVTGFLRLNPTSAIVPWALAGTCPRHKKRAVATPLPLSESREISNQGSGGQQCHFGISMGDTNWLAFLVSSKVQEILKRHPQFLDQLSFLVLIPFHELLQNVTPTDPNITVQIETQTLKSLLTG